jgi:hypothetical protein
MIAQDGPGGVKDQEKDEHIQLASTIFVVTTSRYIVRGETQEWKKM